MPHRPPSRPAPPEAAGVPVPPTPLLGRDGELEAAAALIRSPGVRLVTLTGPGGIGKTRLALELARRLAPEFADGAAVVPLAAVGDPGHVLPALAGALGLADGADGSVFDGLAGALADRSLLLVVDNFEQVLEAAPDIGRLLAAAPSITLVVTSRAVLRIAGEHELAVPPLATDAAVSCSRTAPAPAIRAPRPAGGPRAGRVDLPPARRAAAGDRARRGAREGPAAGGDPARLTRRLDLLGGAGARDAPERQRTLRATIDWSHDLLDPDARELFAQLGVFVGGWTMEVAEAVCGPAALDGIAALADQSLVVRSGDTVRDARDVAGVRARAAGRARRRRRGRPPARRRVPRAWRRRRRPGSPARTRGRG